ncbi:hypothetical protein KEM56_007285 [Ascosphaera pollenicola]|nr:hypothetical protein KEM56_007285 [Ascosphaera pollenicola]
MSSMFIARDQENLVHAHQQAAASKPLNQGIKQFAPKTPGQLPKTPFRRGLNDENDVGLFAGKGTIKGAKNGGENTMLRTVKTGKQDFVTPMVPKTKERAPLGMKTTNAKARAFQTPGQAPKPLGNVNGTNKVNRSLRRPTSLRKKQTPPVKPQQQQPQQTTQNEVKQQLQPSHSSQRSLDVLRKERE